MTSTISRSDGKPGPLTGIIDEMDRALKKGALAGYHLCAEMMQEEVVKRCPVQTGNLKAAFSSPDAIGRNEGGKYIYGLLTPELRRAAHYWQYIEYGTKGHPAIVSYSINPRTGRRNKRLRAAVKSRPAHPFFRPGVAAGRTKFTQALGAALGFSLSMMMPGMGIRGPVLTQAMGQYSARYMMYLQQEEQNK